MAAKNTTKLTTIEVLQPDPNNANEGTERGRDALEQSIRSNGLGRSILLDKHDAIIAGNKTIETAGDIGIQQVRIVETDGTEIIAVKRTDLDLNEEGGQARELAIADNRVAQLDLSWSGEVLARLKDTGTKLERTFGARELAQVLVKRDITPAPDPASGDLQAVWNTEPGQLWKIGRHRLVIGDARIPQTIERLVPLGEMVALIHADPPYGMGKEAEGIANDNLYRQKLLAFQLDWLVACLPYLEEAATVYIWGTAEEVWRLWYSEAFQELRSWRFCNELVWDKGPSGMSIGTEVNRSFMSTERCLMFMSGPQEADTNADNYWEGWEPLRLYLLEQRERMGWSVSDMKKVAGHSDIFRDHWTSKSQWSLPTREVYEAFQAAAAGQAFERSYNEIKTEATAFKRSYDELLAEFYAGRAYFNQTAETTTDVWYHTRVSGEERQGIATPKPVELVERILRVSLPVGGLVLDPFAGSGTTMVAAERQSRTCYAVEIEPAHAAIILQRMADLGQAPALIDWEEAEVVNV